MKTWIVYTKTGEDYWFWCDKPENVIKEFNAKMISIGSKMRAVDFEDANCHPAYSE